MAIGYDHTTSDHPRKSRVKWEGSDASHYVEISLLDYETQIRLTMGVAGESWGWERELQLSRYAFEELVENLGYRITPIEYVMDD